MYMSLFSMFTPCIKDLTLLVCDLVQCFVTTLSHTHTHLRYVVLPRPVFRGRDGLDQGFQTLFLEFYYSVGFQSTPNLAYLIQLVKVLLSSLLVESGVLN